MGDVAQGPLLALRFFDEAGLACTEDVRFAGKEKQARGESQSLALRHPGL